MIKLYKMKTKILSNKARNNFGFFSDLIFGGKVEVVYETGSIIDIAIKSNPI